MVGVDINTLKTTFLLKFWFLTSLFQIKSWQLSKEKLLNLILHSLCFRVHVYPWCLKSLLEIKSRLHCIDIYDNDCRYKYWNLRIKTHHSKNCWKQVDSCEFDLDDSSRRTTEQWRMISAEVIKLLFSSRFRFDSKDSPELVLFSDVLIKNEFLILKRK